MKKTYRFLDRLLWWAIVLAAIVFLARFVEFAIIAVLYFCSVSAGSWLAGSLALATVSAILIAGILFLLKGDAQ